MKSRNQSKVSHPKHSQQHFKKNKNLKIYVKMMLNVHRQNIQGLARLNLILMAEIRILMGLG